MTGRVMPAPCHELSSLEVDAKAAERWCGLIWGGRHGWAQTARGYGGRYLGTSYGYAKDSFVTKAYEWPSDAQRLLAVLLDEAPVADVYVCPLLRDAATRKQSMSHPVTGRHAWLDADDWDEERQASLLGTGLEVLAVSSGGLRGGKHLYVDLGQDLPGAEVTEFSRRLQIAFGTDSYGGNNKLLRLPGTFNHKGRAAGGSSGAVRWLT